MIDAITRNNVVVKGQGQQAMLFAHGYGCDQNMWRFIVPAFEKNYKIVLFDHVGFGNSNTSDYSTVKYNSLQAYADDVLEICEVLELKDVIFVGHSVSAMIGVMAAIKASEQFQKLVLIGPSPRYINDEANGYIGGFSAEAIEGLLESLDSDYLSWSNHLAPVIMGNPDRPELGEELVVSFCQSNVQVAKDFAHITFKSDNRADLPHLKTKSLILQCADDVIAPLPVGQYVHQHLPDSSLVLLKATGHCPNLSAPDETIAAIKKFL